MSDQRSPFDEFLSRPATTHALRAARKAAEEAGGRNLDGVAEAALVAGMRALYMTGFLLTNDVRAAAVAAGYAQAVEALRDDRRYFAWWEARPESVPDGAWCTGYVRRNAAVYLESVGPVVGGQPEQKEINCG